MRIKGCLEGDSGGQTKKNAKEATNKADKDAEMEAAEAAKGKRQLIRGKRKCKRCGELGHEETSYKCRLNGTKKPPKRKARPNTTKCGQNAKVLAKRAKKHVSGEADNECGEADNECGQVPPVTSPTRTREIVPQDSPNIHSYVQYFVLLITNNFFSNVRQLPILVEQETSTQPMDNLMGEGTSTPSKT
jgi:hypothetical protein